MFIILRLTPTVRGRGVQANALVDGEKGCQLPEIKKGEKIARSLLTALLENHCENRSNEHPSQE
jgi:hypothetical protein